MKALEFINNLRENLSEIISNPENHILFTQNNYVLIQKVKNYSLSVLKELEISKSQLDLRYLSHFLIDLMNRDNFKNRVKYAIIKLNELGIESKDYYFFITEGIKYFINKKENNHSILFSNKNDKFAINDLVIGEISNCFQNWYFPRDIFYIKFLEERQLIYKDNQKKSWYVSNLGNYFYRLSTFDSVVFLCAIEVVINNDKGYSRFLNLEAVEKLLSKKSSTEIPHWHSFSYSMEALGLITNRNSSEKIGITNFGEKVLQKLKEYNEDYSSLILFLLESEASGINYNDLEVNTDFNNWFKSSTILNDDQKKSLNNSITLYNQSNYLDSLRIIYPILEGTLDSALTKINILPSDMKGMQGKIEKLKSEKIVSSKISTGIEIFSSRNKILHGNIIEEDSETIKPLFSLVLAYLRKLVTEIEVNLETLKNCTMLKD